MPPVRTIGSRIRGFREEREVSLQTLYSKHPAYRLCTPREPFSMYMFPVLMLRRSL